MLAGHVNVLAEVEEGSEAPSEAPSEARTPARSEAQAPEVEDVDELLVEEISIDGMCGVY